MSKIFRLICLGLILAFSAAQAPAEARQPLKLLPESGYQTPHDLSLPDQNGQRMNFMSRAHKKGLIVLFARSVNW